MEGPTKLYPNKSEFMMKDQPSKRKNESHLMDLLDISFGATSISNTAPSHDGAVGWSSSALGATGGSSMHSSDPWSARSTASPALADPWVPSANGGLNNKPVSASPALRMEPWNTRTQSPSITSNSSVDVNWGAGASAAIGNGIATNGNNGSTTDPWLSKTNGATSADPWTSPKPADPWSPAAEPKDYGVSFVVILFRERP